MKKIIGLIMIAGVSYGASVVTPPGIQVNGLATNNNVMVYSDGMLLDSGVAPTNLVSVTNLTADIEALSATNAAQDALIADNAYAEGTTNKTLIDAAIGNVDISSINTTNYLHVLVLGQSQVGAQPEGLGTWPTDYVNSNCYLNVHMRDSLNAVTQNWIGYLKPDSATEWGVELEMGKILNEQLGKTIYFTKVGMGGQAAPRFLPGDSTDLYGVMTNQVAESMSTWGIGAPDVVVWLQGEAESQDAGAGASYGTSLGNVMSMLDTQYPGIIKIIPSINEFWFQYDGANSVLTNQLAYVASSTNAVFVDAYDCDYISSANGHYNSTGLIDLGGRLAGAIYGLESGKRAETGLYAKSIYGNALGFGRASGGKLGVGKLFANNLEADAVEATSATFGTMSETVPLISGVSVIAYVPFEGMYDAPEWVTGVAPPTNAYASFQYDSDKFSGVGVLSSQAQSTTNSALDYDVKYCSDEMNISFWMKLDASQTNTVNHNHILGRWGTEHGDQYWRNALELSVVDGTATESTQRMYLRFRKYLSGGGQDSYSLAYKWDGSGPDATFDPLVWNHYSINCDTNAVVIYRNGKLAHTRTQAATQDHSLVKFEQIGYGKYESTTATGFSGGLDDVLLLNRKLSAAEIKAMYARGCYANPIVNPVK